MKNNILNTSAIKIEPKRGYSEVQHFPGDTLPYKWDKLVPNAGQNAEKITQKNEECVLNSLYQISSTTLGRSTEFFFKELETSGKTESGEPKCEIDLTDKSPEVVYDCILKNEELDLKEEDLIENQNNMSSGGCNEEKYDDYKIHKCHVCDFQTQKKGNLKRHLVKHNNAEEVYLFGCDKCEFRTRFKGALKKHILKHKDVKEVDLFGCDKCEYQTYNKSYLRRHVLWHRSCTIVRNIYQGSSPGTQTLNGAGSKSIFRTEVIKKITTEILRERAISCRSKTPEQKCS